MTENIKQREQEFINSINDSFVDYILNSMYVENNGIRAQIYFIDQLKISGIRINVSAWCQNQIANKLKSHGQSFLLPTTKIYDKMWETGNQIPPFTRQISSSTDSMIWHSKSITNYSNVNKLYGHICTGKTWILDNDLLKHPGRACNYGWHIQGKEYKGIKGHKNECGQYVIQPKSFVHNKYHVDYSQFCTLVAPTMWVGNQLLNTRTVLTDPELYGLISYSQIDPKVFEIY